MILRVLYISRCKHRFSAIFATVMTAWKFTTF